jgi:hypothetical protein
MNTYKGNFKPIWSDLRQKIIIYVVILKWKENEVWTITKTKTKQEIKDNEFDFRAKLDTKLIWTQKSNPNNPQ